MSTIQGRNVIQGRKEIAENVVTALLVSVVTGLVNLALEATKEALDAKKQAKKRADEKNTHAA